MVAVSLGKECEKERKNEKERRREGRKRKGEERKIMEMWEDIKKQEVEQKTEGRRG